MRLRGQEVKTSPFHGGNTGSIPVGVIFGILAQLGEHLPYKQRVIGSSPIGSIFDIIIYHKAWWLSWLERRPVTAEVVGSNPIRVVFFNCI